MNTQTRRSRIPVFGVLAATVLVAAATDAGAAPPPLTVNVTGLTCEYQEEPLGLGERQPRFSWRLEAPPEQRYQGQTAYQVLVASTDALLEVGKADIWDSGKVASSRALHIAYGGRPLQSRERVFWKVRVWDGKDVESKWSRSSRLEMGLLEASDWSAQWIGLPRSAPQPGATAGAADGPTAGTQWIWFAEGDPGQSVPAGAARYFRTRFALPEGRPIAQAELFVSADDAYRAYVNGHEAGEQRIGEDTRVFRLLRVDSLLQPGRNALAIRAQNASGPARLAASLRVRFEDGGTVEVHTGDSWRTAKERSDGWQTPELDDVKWASPAVLAEVDKAQATIGVADDAGEPVAYLRKRVDIVKPIRRVRAYVTARGVYALFVNGRRVGNDVLRPGFTDYDQRIPYQTYDLTPLVQPGRNAFAAMVGEGWYSGHVADWGRTQWGEVPRFLLQVELQYADGTTERIVTDGGWRASTGALQRADLLMGELYDARLEQPGWNSLAFDDSKWNAPEVEAMDKVALVAEGAPPIQKVAELAPRSVKETAEGSGIFIFDLGQNLVGGVRLRMQGDAGTTVRLRFGEALEKDGTLYTANLRTARATDTYILRGGTVETYTPMFTIHGFRYVEVSGFPGTPTLNALRAIAVSAASDETARFETSHPSVNQLHSNVIWTERAAFIEVPTRGPARDERLGAMADAMLFARTSCFNFHVARFWTKWLQDVRDAQDPSGAFADYAPARHPTQSAAAFGPAGIIVPWEVYRCYGDDRVLERQYEPVTRWVAWVRQANPDLVYRQRIGDAFGDWFHLDAGSPREVVATAYFAEAVALLARSAQVLGKTEDARTYEALAVAIRSAFVKAFVRDDGSIEGDTQTVYALALHFQLLPDELRQKAADRLVRDIKEKRAGRVMTGILGAAHLLPVLSELGQDELAYHMVLDDVLPSWGYPLKQGATTLWERWDGVTPEGTFQDPTTNSLNELAFGSVGAWLYSSLGGIEYERPGGQRLVIRPRPGGGVISAQTAVMTPFGVAACMWRYQSGDFSEIIVIPANTIATVYLPAGSGPPREQGHRLADTPGVRVLKQDDKLEIYEIGSGRYEITVSGVLPPHWTGPVPQAPPAKPQPKS